MTHAECLSENLFLNLLKGCVEFQLNKELIKKTGTNDRPEIIEEIEIEELAIDGICGVY